MLGRASGGQRWRRAPLPPAQSASAWPAGDWSGVCCHCRRLQQAGRPGCPHLLGRPPQTAPAGLASHTGCVTAQQRGQHHPWKPARPGSASKTHAARPTRQTWAAHAQQPQGACRHVAACRQPPSPRHSPLTAPRWPRPHPNPGCPPQPQQSAPACPAHRRRRRQRHLRGCHRRTCPRVGLCARRPPRRPAAAAERRLAAAAPPQCGAEGVCADARLGERRVRVCVKQAVLHTACRCIKAT